MKTTNTITYGDIYIGDRDLEYIEAIESRLGIDFTDAPIDFVWQVANNIIDYIYREAILKLNISENSKKRLIDAIYLNCMCSGIDVESKDFPDDTEQDIIEELLSNI